MLRRPVESAWYLPITVSAYEAFVAQSQGLRRIRAYFSAMKNPLASIDKWEEILATIISQSITSMIGESAVDRFVLQRYAAIKVASPDYRRHPAALN